MTSAGGVDKENKHTTGLDQRKLAPHKEQPAHMDYLPNPEPSTLKSNPNPEL